MAKPRYLKINLIANDGILTSYLRASSVKTATSLKIFNNFSRHKITYFRLGFDWIDKGHSFRVTTVQSEALYNAGERITTEMMIWNVPVYGSATLTNRKNLGLDDVTCTHDGSAGLYDLHAAAGAGATKTRQRSRIATRVAER